MNYTGLSPRRSMVCRISSFAGVKQAESSRGNKMNWDQVGGKWKQYQGKAKEKWGKLTDDDIDVIDGKRQRLVGKIQEHYGIARGVAEKQADEFVASLNGEASEEQKMLRAGR